MNIPQNVNGQATMANSSPVVIASNQTAVLVNGSAVTQPVSAASLPLPSGAATAALQTQPGVDIGDVTVNNASGGSAVNIQDGGNSITVDYATTGSGTSTGALRVELPTNGTGVIATVTAVTAITNALPAGTNAIGKLAANSGIDIGDVDVTSVIPGTGATNLGKAEDAGHTTGDTGVMSLGVRNDALAALAGTDLDYTPMAVDSTGRTLISWAPSAAMIRGTASVTGTTSTSLIAAGSGSLKTYIRSIQVANTGSSASLITFQDGNGGSALGYTIAPAGGGSNIVFEIPIVTTAATALYFAAGTASTTIYVSCQAFYAP